VQQCEEHNVTSQTNSCSISLSPRLLIPQTTKESASWIITPKSQRHKQTMRTRSATEHGKDLMSGEAEWNKIIAQRLWTKICEGSSPVSDSGTGGFYSKRRIHERIWWHWPADFLRGRSLGLNHKPPQSKSVSYTPLKLRSRFTELLLFASENMVAHYQVQEISWYTTYNIGNRIIEDLKWLYALPDLGDSKQ
jgi:hypothetical protein